jgi:predicted enzyme related to lactoylglutathione lyase
MTDRPRVELSATVLGASDPHELAAFYSALLGWPIAYDDPEWAMVKPADGGWRGLSFQREPDHARPQWPAGPLDQQMQAHLDIAVDDLEDGVAYAVLQGAAVAEHQPQDDVRVLVDPAGHPFCLFVSPELVGRDLDGSGPAGSGR